MHLVHDMRLLILPTLIEGIGLTVTEEGEPKAAVLLVVLGAILAGEADALLIACFFPFRRTIRMRTEETAAKPIAAAPPAAAPKRAPLEIEEGFTALTRITRRESGSSATAGV